MSIKIAPSLLAADFACLEDEINKVQDSGADLLHVDVMDGHFVPNITIGPFVVKSIKKIAKVPLDVHLMIENPMKYVEEFAKSGADNLTVHVEACQDNLKDTISRIKQLGCSCGVSLKPGTSVQALENVLESIDLILVMTVEPGFGGQKFMPHMMEKVSYFKDKFKGDIEVDGGITEDTAPVAVSAGANLLVAGTAIFSSDNISQTINTMKELKLGE